MDNSYRGIRKCICWYIQQNHFGQHLFSVTKTRGIQQVTAISLYTLMNAAYERREKVEDAMDGELEMDQFYH